MKNVPYNKGGGKRIDPKLFEEYFMMYLNGQTNQREFAKGVGLSEPTLHKRLVTLMENGYIDGVFFTDNKPMIIGLNGFMRGDEPIETQNEESQNIENQNNIKEVAYPKLL